MSIGFTLNSSTSPTRQFTGHESPAFDFTWISVQTPSEQLLLACFRLCFAMYSYKETCSDSHGERALDSGQRPLCEGQRGTACVTRQQCVSGKGRRSGIELTRRCSLVIAAVSSCLLCAFSLRFCFQREVFPWVVLEWAIDLLKHTESN